MLSKAEDDLRATHGMSDADIFSDGIFGFHAQQAVEKLIKAWLWALDSEPPYIHDIERLFVRLEEIAGAVPEEFATLIALTTYAVEFRYSSDIVIEELDRQAVLERVDRFAEHVKNILATL